MTETVSRRGGYLRRSWWGLMCLLLIGAAMGCGARADRTWWRPFAADSVTLRVWHKWPRESLGWGPVTAPLEWGWDSVTWRALPGDSLTYPVIHGLRRLPGTDDAVEADLPFFRVGRRFGRDSVRLFYRGVCLLPDGPPKHSHGIIWDSVTVSDRPLYFSVYRVDQAPWLKVALLRRWPEPARGGDSTCTVYGWLKFAMSGRASYGRVYVLHTDVWAQADTSGLFVLKGVPTGTIELHATSPGKEGGTADLAVEVPCDTLVISLRMRTPQGRR